MADRVILSTKQLRTDWVNEALEHGIHLLQKPFIHTLFRNDEATRQAVLSFAQKNILAVFTSKNAVAAVAALSPTPPNWTIACLSGATAEKISAFWGADAIVCTATSGTDLAEAIVVLETHLPIVFFSGNQRLDVLPEVFRKAGFAFEEQMVYDTVATPQTITEVYDGVLFFSPSAVESFFSANVLPASVPCFAIGATTAAALYQKTNHPVLISSFPSQRQLLAMLYQYYHA